MNKAVFLDRDGVIIEEKDNLYKIEDIKIIEGVPEALKILKQNNFILLGISNQPVVARGLITEEYVEKIHTEINSRLEKECGVEIDKFFFCPHHPNANVEKYRINCSCRKPNPGLILQAVKEFNIDIKNSFMIGDRISDVITGKRAGCKTILIETDYSKKKIEGVDYDINIKPDFIAKNLKNAIEKIGFLNN